MNLRKESPVLMKIFAFALLFGSQLFGAHFITFQVPDCPGAALAGPFQPRSTMRASSLEFALTRVLYVIPGADLPGCRGCFRFTSTLMA